MLSYLAGDKSDAGKLLRAYCHYCRVKHII